MLLASMLAMALMVAAPAVAEYKPQEGDINTNVCQNIVGDINVDADQDNVASQYAVGDDNIQEIAQANNVSVDVVQKCVQLLNTGAIAVDGDAGDDGVADDGSAAAQYGVADDGSAAAAAAAAAAEAGPGSAAAAAAAAAAEAAPGDAASAADAAAGTAGSDAAVASGGVLPDTGGASLIALGAGALLVAGGLLARRIVR